MTVYGLRWTQTNRPIVLHILKAIVVRDRSYLFFIMFRVLGEWVFNDKLWMIGPLYNGQPLGMLKRMKRDFVSIAAILLFAILPLPGGEGSPQVLNGVDVLRERGFFDLAGKRVGLITNHTGLSMDGVSTIDLFHQTKACRLVALFSPEHGIRGIMDDKIDSSMDPSTGLPIYSLYGKTRRPTAEMLKNLDVLVFDVQDIGARFYTYITTMAYCMEEAARAHIPFYVLDRPNPIGGEHVEGPMLDADKTSFVGYMPLPIRHGMTVGELAQYFNSEKKIGVQLHVISMKGWKRSYYFWETGQLWVDPSPNMRTMTAAILYPGVCLLERTNVSVGRGTDRPFELVGAPWIDPGRFAASVRDSGISGVRVVPVFFTPRAGKNQGIKCGGINIVITDYDTFRSVSFGLRLISILQQLYPGKFDIDPVMELLGNEEVMTQLKHGGCPEETTLDQNSNFLKFLDKRNAALIYDLNFKPRKGRN